MHKLLVIDRDDLLLPRGWVTAVLPGSHEFSDYERTSGIWKIVGIDRVPLSLLAAKAVDLDDDTTMVPAETNLIFRDGKIVERREPSNIILHQYWADNPKAKPMPVPSHLDRSHSVVWDYGPGRTYSTPQAAYNALFASVGFNPFVETHYIRGWSGTYGLSGANVLLFNPAVVPSSRQHLLVCDVQSGETVVWDGQGGGTVMAGNAVSHCRVRDITFGNATFGIAPIAFATAATADDWKVERCEGDGSMGAMSYAVMMYCISVSEVADSYFHGLAAGGVGVAVARHNNYSSGIFNLSMKGNRIDAPYGLYILNRSVISMFNNTVQSTLQCIKDNGTSDTVFDSLINNIFYGEPGSACDCIDAGAVLSRSLRLSNSDGNCWFPGDTGGEAIVCSDTSFADVAAVQTAYGMDEHSIGSDPLLNADLSLAAASPCREAGVCSDYAGLEGNVRAHYVDMGAYQPSAPPLAPNAPSLDYISNDNTGNSVTLTITPPAAGGYDLTRIYYKRAETYEAWSSGGTYVGAQGVAGNVQVVGLNDNQIYDFVLVAEYSSLYSLPSIPRSVLCIASTTAASLPDFVTELATRCASRFSNLTMNTNCFANHLPDAESATLPIAAFFGTGGPAGRFDDAWQELTIQCLVIGPKENGYDIGRNMIKNIEAEYHGSHAWSLPSFFISTGERIQPPYPLGRDEKGRERFVFNLLFKTRVL